MKTIIDIGKLNKRIIFFRMESTEDSMGQNVQRLVPIREVWASFYQIRSKEFFDQKRIEGEDYYKCYCRYRDDIDTECLIKCGKEYFEIKSVVDIKSENKLLDISCVKLLEKKHG